MAKIRQRIQGETKGLVCVPFSFAPNGASAVAASSNKGVGVSVARSDTGKFTLTFKEKYAALVSANATLQLATAADQRVEVGTYTAPTATTSATLVINVWDISAAAVSDNVTANANNRINVVCFFRATGVTV